MSFKSFLACALRAISSFASLLIPSSTAEIARTVPALNAALEGRESVSFKWLKGEKERKETYCWTPGAAF
jgi:hypothetical protein